MKTMNIFKTLALAMLMPAMLLTTACSSEDDFTNNTVNSQPVAKKGYALPVTVNVSRQGDKGSNRATYNDGTRTLAFSAGDQLFVGGNYDDWEKQFAGTLDYDAESGKFKGTIYTQDDTYKTYEDLFGNSDYTIATLLPAGYKDHGYLVINTNDPDAQYDDFIEDSNEYTLATSKADGVAQFSYEYSYNYNNGFALSPHNAILNFTITGLAASTSVNVSLTSMAYNITGTVTTDASGNATFAAGINDGLNLQPFSLTVGGKNITIVSSDKVVAEGKIYNITRNAISGVLNGQFSVSSTKKVKFSKGNLRYASSKWSFFDNQYNYYTSYNAGAWDKFGWSTSATTYGMNTSTSSSTYSGDFVDWGATMGTGWFTLSKDEWTYLFNTRSASTVNGTANGRYAKAKVNNVQGVILFPDTYTHPGGVTAPTGVNATDGTGWNGNSYTVADWTKMESAGCVFLPAAGYRYGSSVDYAGSNGYYWSASPKSGTQAYFVKFNSGELNPAANGGRSGGYSVRLVREVTE